MVKIEKTKNRISKTEGIFDLRRVPWMPVFDTGLSNVLKFPSKGLKFTIFRNLCLPCLGNATNSTNYFLGFLKCFLDEI